MNTPPTTREPSQPTKYITSNQCSCYSRYQNLGVKMTLKETRKWGCVRIHPRTRSTQNRVHVMPGLGAVWCIGSIGTWCDPLWGLGSRQVGI
jgi:hypothetical protein